MPTPPVLACIVSECVHNKDRLCHAAAIAVGQQHPTCDTFKRGPGGSEIESEQGAVGKCDITACRYNDDLACGAPGITVDWHESHADCETFVPHPF